MKNILNVIVSLDKIILNLIVIIMIVSNIHKDGTRKQDWWQKAQTRKEGWI